MALITLTSDFGHQDYLAGAVKGILLNISEDFKLIDVTHSLTPFNYPQAAYICRNALKHFPPFTFHLILVDLFDKKPEQLLLAFHNNQYMICADNGLLTMILEEKPEMTVALPLRKERKKDTLYIAEVMGETIKKIQSGMSLQQIGLPDAIFHEVNPLKPVFSDNWIEGQIIYIDNFENIIVNITEKEFLERRKFRKFRIIFRRNDVIDTISETYADVPEGEKLALFNAAGYLEIAMNKGNAAGLFGLEGFSEKSKNEQNRLFYQTVRILFED